jgi:hypothetical protein
VLQKRHAEADKASSSASYPARVVTRFYGMYMSLCEADGGPPVRCRAQVGVRCDLSRHGSANDEVWAARRANAPYRLVDHRRRNPCRPLVISDSATAFFRGLLIGIMSLGVVVLMEQKDAKETVILGGILGLSAAMGGDCLAKRRRPAFAPAKYHFICARWTCASRFWTVKAQRPRASACPYWAAKKKERARSGA